jgi:hypothetical protein
LGSCIKQGGKKTERLEFLLVKSFSALLGAGFKTIVKVFKQATGAS